MRLTGLTQYAKGLAHHNLIEAVALHSRLESIKWRLWHGNAHEALTRARELAEDVATLTSGYPGLTLLVKATAGLARPPSLSPPSTPWSADGLPRSSKCNGRGWVPIGSCGPKPSTALG
jgi:hypothetical protein